MHIRRGMASWAVLWTAVLLTACGGGSNMSSRALKAITVSPATADGSTSSGSVKFTATAHWSSAPLTTTPFSANWVVCQNNTPSSDVTVSSSGLATCGKAAKGVYSVNAWNWPIGQGSCLAISACGGGCTIEGSAQLTCP